MRFNKFTYLYQNVDIVQLTMNKYPAVWCSILFVQQQQCSFVRLRSHGSDTRCSTDMNIAASEWNNRAIEEITKKCQESVRERGREGGNKKEFRTHCAPVDVNYFHAVWMETITQYVIQAYPEKLREREKKEEIPRTHSHFVLVITDICIQIAF